MEHLLCKRTPSLLQIIMIKLSTQYHHLVFCHHWEGHIIHIIGGAVKKNLHSQRTSPLRPLAPHPLTDIMSKNVNFFLHIQNMIFFFLKFQAFFLPSTKRYIFLADKCFAPPLTPCVHVRYECKFFWRLP